MAKRNRPEYVQRTEIDYVNFKSKKFSTEDVVFRKMEAEARAARRKKNKDKGKSGAEEFKSTLVNGRWVEIDGIVRECRDTGVLAYLNDKTSEWVIVEDIEDLPLSRYNALMKYRNSRSNSKFSVMDSANIKGDLSKITE
ncbi:hypothetical protein SP15_120 [Bacillus phage SP-15]|uniref:Uncharacterized protein n=1 Tax=Bacillus phage SP-15 TaxID=1792032 RepID=A0A127AW96_9CAUD|nr:hypothetical protein SP15_120 [Bacillus phage SP-15]AMM44918.1 hypothetical protein SP15_120 [Bacillus phage SP-15]